MANEKKKYTFRNPILKEIHLSCQRMNATIDTIFSILKRFLLNQKGDNMETKDDLTLTFSMTDSITNKDFIPPTLEEVQDQYEYTDPVYHHSFTAFDNPVMDSQGFVREKNQQNINKSLLGRGQVSIIESSDLRKIQKDHKTLETKFDEMSKMFSLLMIKMDEQAKIITEQTKKLAEQNEEIKELRKTVSEQNMVMREQQETIKGLKEDISLISKQAQYQFEVTQDKLNIQSGIIQNQEKMLNSQAVEIESFKKFVETINEDNTFKQFYRNKMKLHHDQRSKLAFDAKNQIDADFENIPLVCEKWVGQKFSALTGMRDTFSVFTPSGVLTKQKTENEFRKAASQGDFKRMEELLKRDKSIVNGRGMPDSICSRTHEFYDKTALMIAAKQGRMDCVIFLMEHGAEVNFLDRDNFTALDYAQQNFHKPIADYLKKRYAVNGADVLNAMKEKEIDDIVDGFENVNEKPKNNIPKMHSSPF